MEQDYRRLLTDAGFVDVEIQPTRIYGEQDITELLSGSGTCCGVKTEIHGIDPAEYAGVVFSAFVRARKPD